MSFQNFKPAIWSARLLANLDKNLVGLNFVNRDYEGEIKAFGDSVKINSVGDITIKDYDGSAIDDPEELSNSQQTLVIDQAKYYNFSVKDIDKAQSNVDLLDKSMERAAYGMADAIDQDIFGQVTNATTKVGTTAAPILITVDNAYDKLVDLGTTLSGLNVPKINRRIALPSWYLGMLSKDPRFTRDLNILSTGVVEGAIVGGFQLYESNNLKTEMSGALHAMAVADIAIEFANQVVENEAYRPEKNFSDAMKGLNVWGRKTVQPTNMADFIITNQEPVQEG